MTSQNTTIALSPVLAFCVLTTTLLVLASVHFGILTGNAGFAAVIMSTGMSLVMLIGYLD